MRARARSLIRSHCCSRAHFSRISFLYHFISFHFISVHFLFLFSLWIVSHFLRFLFPFSQLNALHRDAHSFTYVTFYYISFIFVPLGLDENVVSPVHHRSSSIFFLFFGLVFISFSLWVCVGLSFLVCFSLSVCVCLLVFSWSLPAAGFKIEYNLDTDLSNSFVMYSCLPFG